MLLAVVVRSSARFARSLPPPPARLGRKLGGYVALAFFTLGCPVSFLVGYLADRHRRIPLFALIIVLGEGACFFTYFTATYTGLLVTRALTGISVGGALPLIFSLLSDMFGSEHRCERGEEERSDGLEKVS